MHDVFVVSLTALAALIASEAIRRVVARRRVRAAGNRAEYADVSDIIRRPRLVMPRAYPGETGDDYRARLGIPPNAPPGYVWSELREAWVAPPATCVAGPPEPEPGETVDAFAERREALGVYRSRAPMPGTWIWNPSAGQFEAPPVGSTTP